MNVPDRENDRAGAALAVQGVPEHSVSLMTRASGGRAFRVGRYLFYTAGSWLIAVGYPLSGEADPAAFDEAIRRAVAETGASDCRLVAPSLPARLADRLTLEDVCYVRATARPIPARLRTIAERAARTLRLEAGSDFTPAHRRLWGEFTGRTPMAPDVQALYARVEELAAAPDCEIRFLNAWTPDGRLAACLVVDEAMPGFDTYLLGARALEKPVPHASDALFLLMLDRAKERGKPFLHLGRGVSQGIARFKRKWGGTPAFPYLEARWREEGKSSSVNVILSSMAADFEDGATQRERWEHDLAQRPFRMLWRLEKKGRVSWLGGTAHFFCKSFETSFRQIFRQVDTVLFEGHLDDASLERVNQAGRCPPGPGACLFDLLTEKERLRLERVVRGPEGPLWRFLNLEADRKADVRWHLRRTQHWYAFFALWCAFLERKGWRYSVDLEAWRLAHSMGRRVLAMEDIEEQLAALRAVPVERVVNHLRSCGRWDRYLRSNARAYLSGDLMGLMGTSTEFPTRTGLIISRRDQRFRERMLPYLEEGRAIALVGSAHLLNLRRMLEEDGFTVRKVHPSLRSSLRFFGRKPA